MENEQVMEKPQIAGWELTHNEKGVEMATLPAEQLRRALSYIEELEQKLNKQNVDFNNSLQNQTKTSGGLHTTTLCLCPVVYTRKQKGNWHKHDVHEWVKTRND